MKRIICIIFALLLSFSVYSCGKSDKSNEIEATGTLEPYYEVEDKIISREYIGNTSAYPGDIERSEFSPVSRSFVINGISSAKDEFINAVNVFSETSADLTDPDILMLCGGLLSTADLTDVKSISEYIVNSLPEMPICMPIPSTEDMTASETDIKEAIGFDIDRTVLLNTVYVISVASDSDGSYTSKLAWLKSQLQNAAEKSSESVIIVSTGSALSDDLDTLLSDYPQVLLISADKTDVKNALSQDKYTHLSLGDTNAIFAVEFDEYSRVLIRALNTDGSVMKNDDGSDLEWFIQTPWDETSFEFKK